MTHKNASHIRIIGGQWRGRRLPVANAAGLRPTPDRVRETLFNWLAPTITGARCLDAFAGTGALGLEALSRGAAEVVFVEKDRSLAKQIQTQLHKLGGNGQVMCSEFAHAPLGPKPFDIIFLDPPFNTNLMASAVTIVGSYLTRNTRVYLEYASDEVPRLDAHWDILKSKKAGQVGYGLATLATTAHAGEDKSL